MKKLLFLLVLAVAIPACKGSGGTGPNLDIPTGTQGSGNAKTETRTLTGFKKIEAGGAVNIDVTFKPEFSVSVEADDNLLPQITTEVDGDTLKIATKDRISTKSRVNIKITMPRLTDFDLSGASTGTITGITGDKLEAEITGASKLTATGEMRELVARANGASTIDAENLKTEKALAWAAGASKITVTALDDLDVDASGASTITYVGSPAKFKQNESGASTIRQK